MQVIKAPSSAQGESPKLAAARWLGRRWPSALAIAVIVSTVTGLESGAEVAPIVTASAFVYLAAAALQHRAATWPMFVVAFAIVALEDFAPNLDPSWTMVAIAAALATYGVVAGALRPIWGMPLQAAAMLLLAPLAILATHIGTKPSGLLVAGGLLVHAVWDVHHHRTGRVVTRSLAEFCIVLDIPLAVAVLVVTLA